MSRRAPAADRHKDPDQWIEAALEAIERGGVTAVAVEPLARHLGVTKGSFYWHFTDRRELLRAALTRWEDRHVVALAERFSTIADPRERLRRILVYAMVEIQPTVILALMAADDDPDVAATLARGADGRLALLQRTFAELGLTPAVARNRAALACGAYLGIAQLRRHAPGVLDTPRKVSAYLRDVESALLHDVG